MTDWHSAYLVTTLLAPMSEIRQERINFIEAHRIFLETIDLIEANIDIWKVRTILPMTTRPFLNCSLFLFAEGQG